MKIAENSFQNDIQTSAVNKRVVVSTVLTVCKTAPEFLVVINLSFSPMPQMYH